MISRRALVVAGAGAVAAMIGFGGCAKAVFPPGGPLDAIPPRILATSPADSSVRVPRNAAVEFLFSESMEHASVRDAVRIRPPAERPQYHWDGRRFRIYWRDPLQRNTTYHVVLRGSARDEHGIPLGATISIHFSTGDSLTPGRITGVVRAITLRKAGVPILVFPAELGTRPDTTATFEPLYESSTDTAGVYSVAGLALGPSYRVFAFYDRNNNDSFDEELDVLAPSPQAIRLTPEHAVADSINIVAVDPRAPAILSGSILASDSTAHYRVEARGVPDSTITRRVDRFGPGPFTLRVPAGSWKLRAQRVPGVDGTPTALDIRREDVIDVKAEEELGGFNFDFRPFEGRTP